MMSDKPVLGKLIASGTALHYQEAGAGALVVLVHGSVALNLALRHPE